jgi:hypothetical protein
MPGKVMKLSGNNITNYLQGLLNRPNSGPRNVNDYDVMNASENILQTI